MDVQLPDGTVIQGVPDGTTKAQLATKLQAKGMKVPPEWLSPAKQSAPTAPPSSLDQARAIGKPQGAQGAVEEAVGEPAAAALTGVGSSIVGGVAGLARGAGAGAAALASGKSAGEAFDTGVEEARRTL